MIVSIHQPAYLPWLGYFDKIRQADLFIYLDTVQFQKGSFQNRNKIRSANGWVWLTVPVETKGSLFSTTLNDLQINNRTNWSRKHRDSIRMNYGKARNFDPIFAELAAFYARPWERLSPMCFEMLQYFCRLLAIDTAIVKASDLPPVAGAKSELVLNLCREVGASGYLSGSLGRDYLDLRSFEQADLEVDFQDYGHPTYPQVYPDFEPYMGIVDLLMCAERPREFVQRRAA